MFQVVLRDGRHLVGVMRSYDQFSNIVLEDTHERHFVGSEYPTKLPSVIFFTVVPATFVERA